MQKKRLIALILTTALLLGMIGVPATAANTDIRLTFSLTDVSGEVPTLELGLHVTTAGTEVFKSVGVVLEFDNSVLALIPWNSYVAYELSYATDWKTAVPIGTKGIDEYMGSAAQAYTDGNKTYLYLSAEAITPQTLPGGVQVATVRFAYKDNKTAADVIPANTVKLATDDNEVIFASPMQHSVVYHNDVDFYYINPLTENAAGAVQPDGEIDTAYILPDPIYKPVQKGESVVPGTGGVNMDDILSIAFYDWDETLLGVLAVPKGEDISQRVNDYVRIFIHPELNDTQEADETLDEAEIKRMMASTARADTYRGKYPSTYGDDNTIDLTGKGYPLTNKLDYVFYKGDTTAEGYDGYYFAHGWIPVTTATLDGRAENGVFTAYESPDAAAAAEPVDFSKGLTESIMVKAAYVPGEDLDDTLATGLYTVTNVEYNRYGAVTEDEGSYSMIATVERINHDGYGVTRLRWPAFRMYVTPQTEDAQDIAIRLDVDSKDETTAEIVAPKLSTRVVMDFIDVTIKNWLGVALKGDSVEIQKDGEDGYLILGTVQAVNDVLRDIYEGRMELDTFEDIINLDTYNDLNITISSSTVGGQTARRWEVARNKLMLGFVGNACQNMDLKYMEDILYMDLTSDRVNNESVYNAAMDNVRKALAENLGQPLTAEQVAHAINNNGELLQ